MQVLAISTIFFVKKKSKNIFSNTIPLRWAPPSVAIFILYSTWWDNGSWFILNFNYCSNWNKNSSIYINNWLIFISSLSDMQSVCERLSRTWLANGATSGKPRCWWKIEMKESMSSWFGSCCCCCSITFVTIKHRQHHSSEWRISLWRRLC